MLTMYNNVAIKGIIAAMPKCIDECAQEQYAEIIGEKKLRRYIKMTGIRRRRVVMNEQKTSDLAIEAVRKLLSEVDWTPDSIDVLVLITQSQDMLLPATSMVIHKELKLKKDMIVFDINLGCSGYTTGLQVISDFLQGKLKRAVLVAGDIMKYYPKWKETGEWEKHLSDWLLFGSAISATAIEKVDFQEMKGVQYINSKGCMDIRKKYGHLTHMNGDAVFSFAINEVVDSIKHFMDDINISDDDVDYYIFHQAQKMILDSIREILEIPAEKMLISYEEFGNTSSASIPLTIGIQPEKFKNGARVLLCGFGVGLAWSAVYTTIDQTVKLGVIETDLVINQK